MCSLERIVALLPMMLVSLVRAFIVITDHVAHLSADLSLWLDSAMFPRHTDTKTCPPSPSRLFPVPPERDVWYWYGCATRRDNSRTAEDRGCYYTEC